MPTPRQLDRARELFERYEPRDLFYRVALDLLARARSGRGEFTVAEALAVVLQPWNRRFYISTGIPFDAEHFADIQALLDGHHRALRSYRRRSIESLIGDEQGEIEAIFDDFDRLLVPPGAAKGLHVLAPRFFPLWDRPIASKGASIWFGKRGTNSSLYWRWILRMQRECEKLGGEAVWGPGLLKRLDEFYYCRFTLEVM